MPEINAAQGSRLASIRPAVTTDQLAFTATLDTEITRLLVCNNTAGAVAFRVYHVPAGGSPGLDNALYYDKTIAANDSFDFSIGAANAGIHLKTAEMLYVKTGTANALGFQVYGVTASIAPGA